MLSALTRPSCGGYLWGSGSHDLSIAVVAPTTCSLTNCLTICRGVPQQRRIWQGGGPTTAENLAGGGSHNSVENSPESPLPVDKSHGGCRAERRKKPQDRLFRAGRPMGIGRPFKRCERRVFGWETGFIPVLRGSLSPAADDLPDFQEFCPQHRTAGFLLVASCVQAGLRKSLPSASHRKKRRWSGG